MVSKEKSDLLSAFEGKAKKATDVISISQNKTGTPYGIPKGVPKDEPIDVPVDQPIEPPQGSPYGSPKDTPQGSPNGIIINENQYILYHCLKELNENPTTLKLISKEIGISDNTLKSNIKRLKELKIIEKHGRIHIGSGKFGFAAKVLAKDVVLAGDNEKVTKIIKGLNINNITLVKSISNPTVHLKVDPTVHPILNSSSSLIDITTTNSLEQSLNNHPELGYWRQKGLTVKQISQWINTAQCTPELMIQYLCYCKFDMVDLGQEEGKGIKDVFNWFFRIIEKSGQYRKPKDYKSHQETQLEAERKLIADREKQIRELKELHRKKYEQERDLAFWQMMAEPDGELYKQCYDRLNAFAKGKAKKGGKVFESAMRKAFDEIEDEP